MFNRWRVYGNKIIWHCFYHNLGSNLFRVRAAINQNIEFSGAKTIIIRIIGTQKLHVYIWIKWRMSEMCQCICTRVWKCVRIFVCLLINMGMELFLVFYNFNFMKEKLWIQYTIFLCKTKQLFQLSYYNVRMTWN